VQGKLQNKYLNVQVVTECAHCSSPMEMEIDSNLHYKTNNERCEPVIFVPDIDLFGIKDDSIIDSF
jgi:hypothetical protein